MSDPDDPRTSVQISCLLFGTVKIELKFRCI